MFQNRIKMNIIFWRKVSNYSIIVGTILLIVKIFFLKYLDGIIHIWQILTAIALFGFFLSQLMKLILKAKNNER